MNSERIVVNSNQIITKFGENIKDIKTLRKQDEIEVFTDTGNVTIENTINGQIEDLKIEGNTLVNFGFNVNGSFDFQATLINSSYKLKPSTTYTFIIKNKVDKFIEVYPNEILFEESEIHSTWGVETPIVFSATTKNYINSFDILKAGGDGYMLYNLDVTIIEGKYTQIPSGYLGGLQSVGDDIGGLEISSKDKNSYQINKKQILYQNSQGFYEKPILRRVELIKDTIEKHLDDKYYYHKKCVQSVLNGNEGWLLHTAIPSTNDKMFFILSVNGLPCEYNPDTVNVINNVLPSISRSDLALNQEGFAINQGVDNHYYSIGISKSKLPTQDVAGFKKWLQNNNIAFVKQGAEVIYKCVNLDLNSYEGNTTFTCNSNVPPYNVSFKIANHINNTIRVMKNRLIDIENKLTETLDGNATQKNGKTGYKILPGGLVLQWGEVKLSTVNAFTSVTFPFYFPNACLNISLTKQYKNNYNPITSMTIPNKPQGWFEIVHPLNANDTIEWFAIGY